MTAEPRPRFKLYTVKELEALPDPDWLIEGLVPQGALAELYGKSNVGKSFLALDWALSVSEGVPWLGRQLNQGDVVYVSAEGFAGLKKRVAAWRVEHPKAAPTTDPSGNASADLSRFRVLPQPVNMRDTMNAGDVEALVRAIKHVPCKPGLVVIDTLARCFGDGDENAAKDMNAFVAGADRIREAFPQATVLVIHHSGKDAAKGDRGSTALRGAADTVMELAASNGGKSLTLKCPKQKDWEPFDKIKLSLGDVVVGEGETSCVIAGRKVLLSPSGPVGNGSDAKALDALRTGGVAGMTYSQWRDASGLPASTFKTARKRLVQDGLVKHEGKLYQVTDTNKGQGQGQGQTGS